MLLDSWGELEFRKQQRRNTGWVRSEGITTENREKTFWHGRKDKTTSATSEHSGVRFLFSAPLPPFQSPGLCDFHANALFCVSRGLAGR